MNFPPFGVGVPLSAALPVATQFSAAGKITQSVTTANGQVVGVLQGGENGVHYIRPIDANAFAAAAAAATQQQQQQGGNGNNQNTGQHQQQQHHHQQQHHQQQQTQTLITLPITMPGAKPGDPQQHVQIQVVNPVQAQVTQQSTGPGQSPKYHISQIPIQTFGQGATVLTVAYNPNQEGIQIVDGQNGIAEGMTVVAALQPQDIQLIQTEPDKSKDNNTGVTPVALIKSEITKDDDNNGETTNIATSSSSNACTTNTVTIPAQYLQNATSVQEYIQKMQHATALPLSLQQFLKFNNPEIKREQISDEGVIETINIQQEEHDSLILNDVDNNDNNNSNNNNNNSNNNNNNGGGGGENDENPDDPDGKNNKKKKKYKKKPPKPKKPKPGQVHIATALDGTTLFCCPECHMAYPEKELLEQHLIGHKIERRFICDICGAGLKRKEHLERHKLGHNPERPFVCSVCMKGFKRKEHLNLHFVIHSGEKTEICGECGKGFYRKDHLRKHARSHITRRAKEQAERSQNQIIIKEPTTTQVTIQVPTSQMQIPVQIQVPQHHIQVTSNSEEESNQVSTVVLPTASEGIILPQN